VAAELSFGFWTSLFDVRYERSRTLWPRLLGHALLDRGSPRTVRTRTRLSPMLNRVRHLRNRVAHHEPVWHWRDLHEQHALALDLLGWFSPSLREAVGAADRFSTVHRDGQQLSRENVRSLIKRLSDAA
jgi:hypothetical protein